MNEITHLDSITDIKEDDIWVFHIGNHSKYRVTGISGASCTLISFQNHENNFNNYRLDSILKEVNGKRCHIERDNPDSYRRVECKSGCGSFVLTPGEEFDDQCPSCREADRLGKELNRLLD